MAPFPRYVISAARARNNAVPEALAVRNQERREAERREGGWERREEGWGGREVGEGGWLGEGGRLGREVGEGGGGREGGREGGMEGGR